MLHFVEVDVLPPAHSEWKALKGELWHVGRLDKEEEVDTTVPSTSSPSSMSGRVVTHPTGFTWMPKAFSKNKCRLLGPYKSASRTGVPGQSVSTPSSSSTLDHGIVSSSSFSSSGLPSSSSDVDVFCFLRQRFSPGKPALGRARRPQTSHARHCYAKGSADSQSTRCCKCIAATAAARTHTRSAHAYSHSRSHQSKRTSQQ